MSGINFMRNIDQLIQRLSVEFEVDPIGDSRSHPKKDMGGFPPFFYGIKDSRSLECDITDIVNGS